MNKPSVADLLKLLDKPALLRWANRIGLQGIELDQYRKNAMAKGSDHHKQIENYIKNNTPFKDDKVQVAWDMFISDKKILECEKEIETEWFKGRMDIKLNYIGYDFVCDFKSHEGVYFENKLQLAAYRMADNPSFMTRIATIEIPNFKLNIIDIWDFQPYEEIIKALVIIYNNKQIIGK